MTMLKTKRLFLLPMTDERMQSETMRSDLDEHMRKARIQMMEGALKNPNLRLWYTNWEIKLPKSGKSIGGLCFKGPPKDAEVEIRYSIDDESERGKGYATEAVAAAVRWAMARESVCFVTAEVSPENVASRRVLEKQGFVPIGSGTEGTRFEKEKPETPYFLVYTLLGAIIGCCVGIAAGNWPAGLCVGLALGVLLGGALDVHERAKRRKLRIQRKRLQDVSQAQTKPIV